MPLSEENERIVDELLSRSWKELEAFEFADYVLFPEVLRRRKATGAFEDLQVCLRVPREPDLRSARLQARAWAEEVELDAEKDPDLFDNMDTMCILATAIRSSTQPHEPFEPDPKVLERRYDRPSLDLLWAKLEGYRAVIDPRPNSMTDRQVLAVTAAIAATRNVIPLHALSSPLQNSYITGLAEELLRLRASKS